MFMRDYKWPSSKRRRNKQMHQTLSRAIALAVGVNGIAYALSLLIPNGMWFALGLLVACSSFTTAIVQDILNDA